MNLENSPSLPDAHQQIRLGDIQASAQKWTAAIEYYSRAIEHFKAVQNTLRDTSLISIIQAQIVQCEKTINFYRLKDRAEQATKAAHGSKIPRARSVSSIKPTIKMNRPMTRNNTIHIQNTTDLDNRDSFAAMIFPNNRRNSTDNSTKNPPVVMMAKKTKNDSEKLEELQMSNEALKKHLERAFDNIEQLKHENNVLRIKRESDTSQNQEVVFGLTTNHENGDEETEESEDKLEDTI